MDHSLLIGYIICTYTKVKEQLLLDKFYVGVRFGSETANMYTVYAVFNHI